MLALAMPVVVGGLGLGAEVGYWYFNQRKLQQAADMAAFAAAVELRAGHAQERMTRSAAAAAEGSGFDTSRGRPIDLRTPFNSDPSMVEVRVTEVVPRMFTGLFLREPLEVSARAVAQVTGSVPSCVLGLTEDTGTPAVRFGGNSRTTVHGCNVHSNSYIEVDLSNNGVAEPECASSVHPLVVASGIIRPRCGGVVAAGVVADPFKHSAAPTLPANTTPRPDRYGPNETHQLSPGFYPNGLHVQGGASFAPGVYVIDGALQINSTAAITGQGVTFFVRGDRKITINGGSNSRLSAPEGGFLIYAPGSRQRNVMNGGSGAIYEGIAYTPEGQLDVLGNNTSNHGCWQIVAMEVEFTGNAAVGIDCRSQFEDIAAARRVQLVE